MFVPCQASAIILSNVPRPSPLWVNVSAIANLDPTTAVWSIVNVTLIPVPLPPVFNSTALAAGYSVAEGWSGFLLPGILATDPQESIARASLQTEREIRGAVWPLSCRTCL